MAGFKCSDGNDALISVIFSCQQDKKHPSYKSKFNTILSKAKCLEFNGNLEENEEEKWEKEDL